MLEIHEFLMTFDDSGAYQRRDYRAFSRDTKRHIEEAG